jgi:hypothetical protein
VLESAVRPLIKMPSVCYDVLGGRSCHGAAAKSLGVSRS